MKLREAYIESVRANMRRQLNNIDVKSIEIQSGDTLWGIAEEYMNEKDGSIIEYIDEVKEINGLKSDDIQDSQYLTIAYYDTAFR